MDELTYKNTTPKSKTVMKIIISYLNFTLLLSVLFFCCHCSNSDSQTNEISEKSLNELKQMIDDVKNELQQSQITFDNEGLNYWSAATFKINYAKGNFYLSDIEYYNAFSYSFIEGFRGLRMNLPGGGIRVSCDTTSEDTVCELGDGVGSGMKQIRCVGRAIQRCLDSGSCATVCSVDAELSSSSDIGR